jgi:moderate conductance mechanosensitive channel
MLYFSLPKNMMSSPFTQWFNFTISNALHLLAIVVLALLATRLLRGMTNLLIKPAASQTRVAQAREQQTHALANGLYSAGSKIIWGVAVLTALPEFGISALPVVALLGLSMLGLGFGAQNVVRDVVAGLYIAFEDQYIPGDMIQAGEVTGRVEQLTLRRTVVRDLQGALVTIANGTIQIVSNLSRDWSQAFVDISVAPETPVEKSLQALETAAADLRGDPSWTQALVDGPRVLGVQSYDQTGSTLRLQVRTAPTRQEEVSRELRRRIQIEFQRQNIPLSGLQLREQATGSRTAPQRVKPGPAS